MLDKKSYKRVGALPAEGLLSNANAGAVHGGVHGRAELFLRGIEGGLDLQSIKMRQTLERPPSIPVGLEPQKFLTKDRQC